MAWCCHHGKQWEGDVLPGVVQSMKEKMEVDNEAPGTENLEEERKMMEEELGELR